MKKCMLGLLFGGAIVMLVWSVTTNNNTSEEIGIELQVACAACEVRGLRVLTERPATCDDCGERAVWPAMRCSDCGVEQAIDQDAIAAARLRDAVCRACGGARLAMIPAEKDVP